MTEKPSFTILIVDDTEASRSAVGQVLQQAQFTVREAGTGTEALRLAAERPDLIILNVNLPDMSGFEVCRRIKANPTTASTPVLHLSANFVRCEDRAVELESGADGYLTYPLEPRELVATVQALLRVREAERAARALRELLRMALTNIDDGVAATDAEGLVTFINPAAQDLTGWGEDAVGKPLRDIFKIVHEGTGQPPKEHPVDVALRSGRKVALSNHVLLLSRDGRQRPVDDAADSIRDDEGRFLGVVLVFRELTDQRRLQAELQQRSEDLAQRDRCKDELLATLGHELRNPLAPLRYAVQTLRMKFARNQEIDQAGAMMERQLSHLVQLVDDLLDVSRITRGTFELRKKRLDLAPLILRATESIRPLLLERKQQLEIRPPSGPLFLEADPARLEQALIHLLTNAAKYTPSGGRIIVAAEREGDAAVIRVTDNGIGIRPEMLGQIFDLFQQADHVPGRVAAGLGVGLGLVRRLVEMHGGTITASSLGPDQGSEFTTRLPALPDAPADLPLVSHSSSAAVDGAMGPTSTVKAPAPARPLRILVTDDNADAADSLAMLLRLRGHDVQTAYDGRQTLETVRTFRPHVVLLDIALPHGMDGYEVARRIRQQGARDGPRIVAMTGYGQPEDVARAIAAGMDSHITKPARLDVLQKVLAEAQASS